ncbi:MAG: alpha-1,4-glucan--maltose-1-phosphate maltosyltransferase [Puniceicoccaceae bacterium]
MQTDPLLSANRRVIIEAVEPSVEGGLFPAKSVVGDRLQVSATIFADGHDHLGAVAKLRIRGEGDAHWQEFSLYPTGNDRWAGECFPEVPGLYELEINAWVDHFATWRAGFEKKLADGQNPIVETQIGLALVEDLVNRCPSAVQDMLSSSLETLRREETPMGERIQSLLDPRLQKTALEHPDRRLQTSLPAPLPLLVERRRAAFSAWYEFFPRSWSTTPGKHGSFAEASRILPEIARMGFDIVYLPPIHPIGVPHRKGRNNSLTAESTDPGSPWAIGGGPDGGHKAIHPELGTFDDFERFNAQVSELGMELALDIAFQCAPDHPWVSDHPDWFKWRPDGTVQYAENPPKKYQDILPLHFETEDWENLWHELRDVFLFWIGKGVQVFRVDNPHTKSLEFWRWCILSIKEEHPGVIFLSEAFTRPALKYRLAKSGFTHGYTYFTWRTSRDEIIEYLEDLTTTDKKTYFWPNFWPNTPDILHHYLQTGGRPAFIVRLVLASTLSSNFGIYGPAFELCLHVPFPGKEEYIDNEKYEIKVWNWDAPGNLRPVLARINQIRRANPALQRTFNLTFVPTDNPQIIAYLKISPDQLNIILVVVNLDPFNTQSGWLDLPLHLLGINPDQTYLLQDLFPDPLPNGYPRAQYLWTGSRNYVELPPRSTPAHIFKLLKRHRQESDFDYWL